MRKLTLILTALFALCIFGAAAGVAEEAAPTASAADVLSAFTSDSVELDLMLIFSGEAPDLAQNSGANCYNECQQVLNTCLWQCGPGFYCDMHCNNVFNQCMIDRCDDW